MKFKYCCFELFLEQYLKVGTFSSPNYLCNTSLIDSSCWGTFIQYITLPPVKWAKALFCPSIMLFVLGRYQCRICASSRNLNHSCAIFRVMFRSQSTQIFENVHDNPSNIPTRYYSGAVLCLSEDQSDLLLCFEMARRNLNNVSTNQIAGRRTDRNTLPICASVFRKQWHILLSVLNHM
jgi:hypothetical protein